MLRKPEYQLVVKFGTLSAKYFSGATDASNPVAKKIFDMEMKNNPEAYEMSVKAIENRLLKVGRYLLNKIEKPLSQNDFIMF